MELEVLRHHGIPESGIISIRAGGTRRQAQISTLDRPLKFPCEPGQGTTFKVDILDLLGSGRLAYNPGENEYSLSLDSACGGDDDMEVAFRVRRAGDPAFGETTSPVGGGGAEPRGGAEPKDDRSRDARKEAAARDYLEKHGLTAFMQFLMQSLMKDKPPDPYSFLQKQVTKRMVTEVSRSVAGDKVDLLEDKGLETLLKKFNSTDAPLEVTVEQLEQLERDAAAAGEQLRTDNVRLRETAEQLKYRYGQLIEESAFIHKQAAAKAGLIMDGEPRMPPVAYGESPQMATYREIARMQDDISDLARENADLVAELANMRAAVETAHVEMDEMQDYMPRAWH